MWTESQKAEKLAETETKQTVLEKGGKPKVLEDMVEIYFRKNTIGDGGSTAL